MSILDIIEAAVPCSVCADDLRSTCESLGQCKTRDAWRRAEREVALMEAVCEAAATYRNTQGDGDLLILLAEADALTAYRKERGL